MPTLHTLLVDVPARWLADGVKRSRLKRWALAGFPDPPQDMQVPVRVLRALYVLPDDLYADWTRDQLPAAYEYFCRQSSMNSYGSQKMQEFLRRMTLPAHFYTQAGR